MAFAIGRAYGPAVARNRARRQLRALLAGNPPPPGWYLIGVQGGITPPIPELTFATQSLVAKLNSAVPSSTD